MAKSKKRPAVPPAEESPPAEARRETVNVRMSLPVKSLLNRCAVHRGYETIGEFMDAPDVVEFFQLMLADMLDKERPNLPTRPAPGGRRSP